MLCTFRKYKNYMFKINRKPILGQNRFRWYLCIQHCIDTVNYIWIQEKFFLHQHLTSFWHDLAASPMVIHLGETPFHTNLLRSARKWSRFRSWSQLLLHKLEQCISCNSAFDIANRPTLLRENARGCTINRGVKPVLSLSKTNLSIKVKSS